MEKPYQLFGSRGQKTAAKSSKAKQQKSTAVMEKPYQLFGGRGQKTVSKMGGCRIMKK
jgi:hypothetical protein